MKLLAYVRVSSKDQNEDRQVEKMLELGVAKNDIYIDRKSGKDFDRDEYKALRRNLRAGDLLYIDSLDRLGRNYDGIIREWKEITLDADIVCLDKADLFDSRKFKQMGDIGKLMEDQFLSLLSYLADQERKKIRSRQAEGIKIAKDKGIHFGRDPHPYPSNWGEVYMKWKNKNITAVYAMKLLGLKKSTYYKMVKRFEIIEKTEDK